MKKIIVFFCIITLSFFLSNVSFAQEPEKKFGLGARVSYLANDDDDIEGVKIKPDETAFFEGNITYFVNRLFSLELGLGYDKMDIDLEALGISFEFGELKQMPVLLTGRFHWWFTNDKASLYIGGGLGYYANDFDVSGLVLSVMPGLGIDADDSFGFHVNGGLEFFFANNIAINLDLKYVWNEIDFTASAPGIIPEGAEIDSDGFIVGVGLKYYF